VVPELATVAESGVPGYEANNWNGVAVPAGAPPRMQIERLQREIKASSIRHARQIARGRVRAGCRYACRVWTLPRERARQWGKVVIDAGVKPE
jgi:hypothetical protein